MRSMAKLHARIDETVKNPVTAESLKPYYMQGCKRPTFHDGFLPVFNQPNVTLVDTKGKGIEEVIERGPVFEGTEYELDFLIMATGFEVQVTGIYNHIVGMAGLDLQEKYRERGMRTLLGIHTQGFPNLYIVAGYQAAFSFNLTDVFGQQAMHIAQCIGFCRQQGGHRCIMNCLEDKEEWWVRRVIETSRKTNFSKLCTPGYYNFEGDSNRRPQDGVYRGSVLDYYENMDLVAGALQQYFEFE